MKRNKRQTQFPFLIVTLGTILFILACELPVLATPVISNSPPGSIETIVFETAAAAQTLTFVALPATDTVTATIPPTKTPSITPSPTETVIIKLPTWTPSVTLTATPRSVGESCGLVAQNPENNQIFKSDANFDMEWTLRNTGTVIWSKGDFDFEYVSGDKIYKVKRYDLPTDVEPGNDVVLTVRMKAPDKSGTYTTTWGLLSGKSTVCKVSLTIIVQ
jgi:hypothetical protein